LSDRGWIDAVAEGRGDPTDHGHRSAGGAGSGGAGSGSGMKNRPEKGRFRGV